MSIEERTAEHERVETPRVDDDETILILSDDVTNRKRYEQWIGGRFQVSGAGLAVDAVSNRPVPPDVVVIERLRSMDTTILTALRNDGYDGAIGVILPSKPRDGVDTMTNTGYVTHPVSRPELEELISRLIRRRRYRLLLVKDYQVTSKLSELKVTSREQGNPTAREWSGLEARKRRLRSSIRDVLADFDTGDYSAIFEEGFTDKSHA